MAVKQEKTTTYASAIRFTADFGPEIETAEQYEQYFDERIKRGIPLQIISLVNIFIHKTPSSSQQTLAAFHPKLQPMNVFTVFSISRVLVFEINFLNDRLDLSPCKWFHPLEKSVVVFET
eukprot:m.279308 g.279308  ORF g.279308 m.279308 type:complete len:120 (+) comp40622_c2_seq60:3042-3401(+)